ncbi:MAG TPA: hypothetical protein VIM12_05995 [Noviherbaspirillum sp.]|jgi:hypothetical protein|uniref:hypothetical protein n=1 Tax=Noviherbaspirillum sp. TaxID=1926288 RepID=UPI002F9433F8
MQLTVAQTDQTATQFTQHPKAAGKTGEQKLATPALQTIELRGPVPTIVTKSTIEIEPKTLKLKVDTPTDWPIFWATVFVGVVGAVATFAIGRLAFVSQKNQIRSSTAQFRKEWQTELRHSLSKFVSLVSRMGHEIKANSNYMQSSASDDRLTELVEIQARIEMMLDPQKRYSEELIKNMETIVDLLQEDPIDLDAIERRALELINQSRAVLEKTWQDIREDLGG